MVQKYGIEGLLMLTDDIDNKGPQIEVDTDKEEVYVNKDVTLKVFDQVKVQIVAKMVEFRRSIILVYAND